MTFVYQKTSSCVRQEHVLGQQRRRVVRRRGREGGSGNANGVGVGVVGGSGNCSVSGSGIPNGPNIVESAAGVDASAIGASGGRGVAAGDCASGLGGDVGRSQSLQGTNDMPEPTFRGSAVAPYRPLFSVAP